MKKIVSAFPGCGKTYLFNQKIEGFNLYDSDSSLFSWDEKDGKKVRNEKFPKNYIDHIVNLPDRSIVLTSSHSIVREELIKVFPLINLVIPDISIKDEFISRYKKRGSPDSFIELLDKSWNDWVLECIYFKQDNPKKVNLIILKSNEYLIHVMDKFL